LVLLTAYQATAYYASAGANESTLAATQQASYHGATSTTYGGALSLAAPALRLVLRLGYRASQHENGQQKCENSRERFHMSTKCLGKEKAAVKSMAF